MLLLAWIFEWSAQAATWTVCASGCDYAAIQAAIDASAVVSGDTIQVTGGTTLTKTYTECIDYAGKSLAIESTTSAAKTVLDCNGGADAAVIFDSGEASGTTLQGFTIRNETKRGVLVSGASLSLIGVVIDQAGSTSINGGGIYATSAQLDVSNSTIKDADGSKGGGIYLENGSTVSLTDTEVQATSASASGGGAYVSSTGTGSSLILDGATFSENVATTSGGAIYVEAGSSVLASGSFFEQGSSPMGGSLHLASGVSLDVDTTEFQGNAATEGGGGGAIYGAGANTLTLDSCTLDWNTSTSEGGAIRLGADAVVISTGNTFSHNATGNANGGAAWAGDGSTWDTAGDTWSENDANGSSRDGGAIYLGVDTALTCAASQFANNAASQNGGAIRASDGAALVLDTCSFTSNTAASYGGALALSTGGSLQDDSSTYTSNHSKWGGAIYSYGSSWEAYGSTFTSNSTESTNSTYQGGAVWFGYSILAYAGGVTATGNSAGGAGGAFFFIDVGETVLIEDSTFTSNTSLGIGWYYDGGGALSLVGTTSTSASHLEVHESTFVSNYGLGTGGAIAHYGYGDVSVFDSVFDGNSEPTSSYGGGGAIRVYRIVANESDLTLTGNEFRNNTSYENGGAVYSYNTDNLLVSDSVFVGNSTTGGWGGALHLEYTDQIEVKASSFCANTASGWGGAVNDTNTTAGGLRNVWTNNVFQENSSAGDGAFHGDTAPRFVNNTFVDNGTTGQGVITIAGYYPSYVLINNIIAYGTSNNYTVWNNGLIQYNLWYSNTSPWGEVRIGSYTYSGTDAGTGNISVDPLFTSYSRDGNCDNDDLTLAPGSPAIDAGDPTLWDTNGTRSDIGAYGGGGATIHDMDADGYWETTDCDDLDADTYPDAPELCDGIDNDCDGEVIDELTTTYYLDSDGDGFGDANETTFDCELPSGYSDNNLDCDDTHSEIHPGADEVCNDIDDDCDESVDDGAIDAPTWYADSDSDAFGDASAPVSTCDEPEGTVADSSDCDDGAASTHPGAPEVCNDVDDDCDESIDEDSTDFLTWYGDADGDGFGKATVSTLACEVPEGYVANSNDCDDTRAFAFPGAAEAESTTACREDEDEDGYGDEAPSGGSTSAGKDCDDTSATVWPGADEIANDGIDQDCDAVDGCYEDLDNDNFGTTTVVDANDLDCSDAFESSVPTDCDDTLDYVFPGAAEHESGTQCREDQDGDGYGDSTPVSGAVSGSDCDDLDTTIYGGASEVLADGIDQDCDGGDTCFEDADMDGHGTTTAVDGDLDCTDPGEAPVADDCNDTDGVIYPGATELANGRDEDCDGTVDEGTEYYDDDGDGYTEAGGDCDDAVDTRSPEALETCNDIDDDCDGSVDEGTSCVDDDGDGASEDDGDCNDGDDSVYPNANETANGVDDDCDGKIDEGLTDLDGDGWTTAQGDCDDADSGVFPGQAETENGTDDDCDGIADEGFDGDSDGVTVVQGDCDDGNGWTFPGARELCDGVDNDCDGELDEACEEVVEQVETSEGKCAVVDPVGSGALLLLLAPFIRRSRRGAVAGAALLAGCSSIGAAPSEIRVVPSPILANLGSVPAGEDQTAEVTLFHQVGDAEVVISDVALLAIEGGGFSFSGDVPITVPNGGSVTVPFFLDASELGRAWSHVVFVSETKGLAVEMEIDLLAHVVAAHAAVFPTHLDFGRVPKGTEASRTLTITNSSAADLTLLESEISGTGVSLDAELPLVLPAESETEMIVRYAAANDLSVTGDITLALSAGELDIVTWAANDCENGDRSLYDDDSDGYASCADDCDDDDATAYPGAPEIADGVDQDCDGTVDEGTSIYDDDEDGQSEEEGDCNDADGMTYTGAPELEDWYDNDCDDVIDEGTDHHDDDGDGYTEDGGDCDDAEPDAHPGHAIVEDDGIDNDCDGSVE